jgi:hypothetical protein
MSAEDKNEMIIYCQTIDANCNDCKHFNPNGVRKEVYLPSLFGVQKQKAREGTCNKHNQIVYGTSNQYQGNSCFEHRRNDSL